MSEKAAAYQREIYDMFSSPEFSTATAEARKEIVGTAIYKHVSAMVGEANAPKVTGMIIDLDPAELNMSIQNYGDLSAKVGSAMQLLVSNNLITVDGQGQDGEVAAGTAGAKEKATAQPPAAV